MQNIFHHLFQKTAHDQQFYFELINHFDEQLVSLVVLETYWFRNKQVTNPSLKLLIKIFNKETMQGKGIYR
jgi:hypothetical protein